MQLSLPFLDLEPRGDCEGDIPVEHPPETIAADTGTQAQPEPVDPAPAPEHSEQGLVDAASVGDTPPQPPSTLADVMRHLRAAEVKTRRNGDMRSALRTVQKVLGVPLAEIPAQPVQLATLLGKASPAVARVTHLRWIRVRSLVLTALVEQGVKLVPGRDVDGPSDAWRSLAERLPDKKSRIGLHRGLSYFTREGIKPESVCAADFDRFREALLTGSLQARPERIYRTTVRLWNAAAQETPGWPNLTIGLAPNPRHYALPWEDFPESLCAEVEAFLIDGGDPDPLSDDFRKALKPGTVELRRKQIHQAATALVMSGFPQKDITSLGVLTAPPNAKAALRQLLDRKGGKTTPYLAQQAQLLATIARDWVKASSDELKGLRTFASNLRVPKAGMTSRNKERLRQFDLPANQDALLNLPSRVMKAAARAEVGDLQVARRVMYAIAVEILIMAPLRMANLTNLELGRQLQPTRRDGHQIWHIVIPAEEGKTNQALEMGLPPESCALLESYLETYRPRLGGADSTFLFPGRGAAPRSPVALSNGIQKFISDETGIKMHSHLFRHLAGKLHLEVHPQGIETVRQVLGHRSSATTLRSYTQVRTAQAFRNLDATIAERRENALIAAKRTPEKKASK